MIILQGLGSLFILKVKSSLDHDDKIGKVLITSFVARGGIKVRESLPEGLEFYTKKGVGGNMVNIAVGHCQSPRCVSSSV